MKQEEAHARGRLATVFYCSSCATKYDATLAAIMAERVRSVAAFQEFRTAQLAGLRATMERLPDE